MINMNYFVSYISQIPISKKTQLFETKMILQLWFLNGMPFQSKREYHLNIGNRLTN